MSIRMSFSCIYGYCLNFFFFSFVTQQNPDEIETDTELDYEEEYDVKSKCKSIKNYKF